MLIMDTEKQLRGELLCKKVLFRQIIPCWQCHAIIIQMCLVCLLVLVFSWNLVDLCTTPQSGAGLVEAERHAVFNALHVSIEHPAVVADPGVWSGLTAAGDAADLRPVLFQIGTDFDLFQHGFVDDGFNRQRQFQIDRKPFICHPLIFAGTADMDVFVSIAPVCRKSIENSLRPFRDHVKITV